MTDIVERPQHLARNIQLLYPDNISAETMCEAADEIKRLRAAVAELTESLCDVVDADYLHRDHYPDDKRRWKRDRDNARRFVDD